MRDTACIAGLGFSNVVSPLHLQEKNLPQKERKKIETTMSSGGEQSEGETTQRDNAEPRRCELCPKRFKVTRSLKQHYIKQHGLAEDSELVGSIPKSPKKLCKQCGKAVSNLPGFGATDLQLLSYSFQASTMPFTKLCRRRWHIEAKRSLQRFYFVRLMF